MKRRLRYARAKRTRSRPPSVFRLDPDGVTRCKCGHACPAEFMERLRARVKPTADRWLRRLRGEE